MTATHKDAQQVGTGSIPAWSATRL